MSGDAVHRVGFLLFPRFQMLAYVLATETLRLANKAAARPLFEWRTASPGAAAVEASNGVAVSPTAHLEALSEVALLLVCAGYEPLKELDRATRALLRRRARFEGHLGGLDTGAVILAELGLLTGYRAAVHWEAHAGFRETYPDIVIEDAIYVLDRDRLTAAGGTATGDAVLAWIAQVEGAALAARTAEALVHGAIREGSQRQRPSESPAVHPAVSRAVAIMKANLEEPLSLAGLAEQAGIGQRRLGRLFHETYGQPPSSFYMGLRLDRARDLLAATERSVAAVGLACGFSSPAWFSRAYAKRFGLAPGQHRRLLMSGAGSGLFPRA